MECGADQHPLPFASTPFLCRSVIPINARITCVATCASSSSALPRSTVRRLSSTAEGQLRCSRVSVGPGSAIAVTRAIIMATMNKATPAARRVVPSPSRISLLLCEAAMMPATRPHTAAQVSVVRVENGQIPYPACAAAPRVSREGHPRHWATARDARVGARKEVGLGVAAVTATLAAVVQRRCPLSSPCAVLLGSRLQRASASPLPRAALVARRESNTRAQTGAKRKKIKPMRAAGGEGGWPEAPRRCSPAVAVSFSHVHLVFLIGHAEWWVTAFMPVARR